MVKRIVLDTKRPPSEILALPASDLEWWSLFYSIEDNNDKPDIRTPTTLEDRKAHFRALMSNWKTPDEKCND